MAFICTIIINRNTNKQEIPENIFEILPEEFIFSSGVGAWYTSINIQEDGTFVGKHQDTNPTEVYICNFKGKFSKPIKIDEYTYSMKLETLETEGVPEEVYYEEGMKFIYSGPYGFDNADEFLIYLPGASIEQMPKGFLSWAYLNSDIRKTTPKGYYGIYNVGGEQGFVGMEDNSFWYSDYCYNYGEYESELWPNYSRESNLVFFEKDMGSVINLCFKWSEDDQTEFVAYDHYDTGEYHISIDTQEDLQTIKVKVKSKEKVDLSPWGGTKDGKFEAEYKYVEE